MRSLLCLACSQNGSTSPQHTHQLGRCLQQLPSPVSTSYQSHGHRGRYLTSNDQSEEQRYGKGAVAVFTNLVADLSADWQMTFTIQDAEMMKIPSPTKGLKARFFVQHQSELPQIRSVGDIILIRSCKVALMPSNWVDPL